MKDFVIGDVTLCRRQTADGETRYDVVSNSTGAVMGFLRWDSSQQALTYEVLESGHIPLGVNPAVAYWTEVLKRMAD